MDSYDYSVLAEEFRRYGTKGRDALIRRLRKGGTEAGHAADLLALSRDASALPPLKALLSHEDDAVRTLAQRTYEALDKRLSQTESDTPHKAKRPPLSLTSPCPTAKPASIASQQREMPFFEADVSQPDRFGAYRPSALYRVALPQTQRSDLISAVSVPGGWLAGYSGGLIRYDNETGEPDILSDASVISLQRKRPSDFASGVWAILDAPDGVLILDAVNARKIARLNGQLTGLARSQDNHLILSTSEGVTLSLSPDGDLTTGCKESE